MDGWRAIRLVSGLDAGNAFSRTVEERRARPAQVPAFSGEHMRKHFALSIAFSAIVFLLMPDVCGAQGQGAGTTAGTTAEPQYLLFQIFTASPAFTTEPGKQAISKLPEPDFLDRESRAIRDAVGERGDDLHRLGVMVGPLALDYTDAQLRALIERSFAIASKYKIAVGLHIDDSKFWMNRRDLWSNPANVEWLDWKGTPNTGQYLNWGEVWRLAPQACFNSPAMLDEARRVAGKVIGPAIAEHVAKLRAKGEEALFAGVIVGWETAIGRDFETRRDLGYCALTNLGFSEKNPPADPDRALETVVQGWIETWSKSLADAGVPRDRIYSHIAFSSQKQFVEAQGSDGRSYSQVVMHTPPAVAFGMTYRPGFTTYPDAGILGDIYAARDAHGHPPWASSEGTNVNIHAVPPGIPQEGMEDYLARMFNHGATMANVFGWDVGGKENLFRRATEADESMAAYRKFLRGARLDEKPLAQSYRVGPSALQRRLRALPDRIESYRRAGGDPRLIQPQIKRLEEAVQDGRFDAMQQELDLIEAAIDLKLPDRPHTAAAGFDVAALEQQMRALPHRIEIFQQRRGDISLVKSRVESIQRHLAAGALEKAFEELQALDRILESP